MIKPKEATTEPYVHYKCSENDSLWTLLLTNPDGHFTDNSSEYLHWMVSNIKGNDLSTGQVIAPYLQPFPAFGTGYHRYVFVLFKQVIYWNLLRFCWILWVEKNGFSLNPENSREHLIIPG